MKNDKSWFTVGYARLIGMRSICSTSSRYDEIWHAGDIGTLEVAQKLAAFRPFRAVYGNIDGQDLRRLYPQVLRLR